ncbi:unnamed protein product [Dovyalis caffra]|uniref:Peptidase A1 domain-containing protein n=1 Tax=Dovyalis caffra TaxID=77055 RepID=A0AAV1RIU7_9ROSI|nr:unnamed protein product [Dovyalis caffra]
MIDHFMSSNTTEPDLFSSSVINAPSSAFTIPIYNKELFTKSKFKDHKSLVQARIDNDISRIKQIKASHLEPQVNPTDYYVPYFGFVSDVNGVYVAAFKAGTPLIREVLMMDTGSVLIWWNCNPCKNCIKRSRLYDPRRSSSHHFISCDDPICKDGGFGCRQSDYSCAYKINYADGGYSRGEIGSDKFTTTTDTVLLDRMVFGCSRDVEDVNQQEGRVTGVLGLNRGKYSLIGQMNAQNFTVCLPAHYGEGKNELRIHVLPPYYYPDSVTVPLVDNPARLSYYVGLNGISVGGERVKIPDDAWIIKPNGTGGVIIDLGTFLTWLESRVFHPFNDLFVKKAAELGLRRVQIGEIFQSCFKMPTPTSNNIPSVEFHFSGVYKTFQLGPEQIMVKAGDSGFYCLAFAEETELQFSLIGSSQTQKTRLAFDLASKRLNMNPNYCN